MFVSQCRSASLSLILVLSLLPARTDARPPRTTTDEVHAAVGEPPLPLDIRLIQSPSGASPAWESLRGKIVVLEFWATWCGPCVAMTPHFNRLQARFASKPVVFISITDEDEATVREFVKKKPMSGWIGIDRDGSTFKAYGITSRPSAAVIDASGNLVGWTGPSSLAQHPEILEDLIAGRDVSSRLLPTPKFERPDTFAGFDEAIEGAGAKPAPKPLCLVLIRPATEGRSSIRRFGTSREFWAEGRSIRDLIAKAYDIALPNIVVETPLSDEDKYDLIFRWSKGSYEAGYALLKQAVAATFGLEIRRERREADVYVLGIDKARRPALEEAIPGVSYDPETGTVALNADMLKQMKAGRTFFLAVGGGEALAKNLSYGLKRPVVDETQLEGNYHFYVPFDIEQGDAHALIAALEAKYPLSITPARRTIDVVVVSQVGRVPPAATPRPHSGG